MIFQSLQDSKNFIQPGLCVLSFLLYIGVLSKLLFQITLFSHEFRGSLFIEIFNGIRSYGLQHGLELGINFCDPNLDIQAFVLAILGFQPHTDVQLKGTQHISTLLCRAQDCRHDGILQHTFFHCRRVVAVFLAEVQPVNAPPDRFLLTFDCPGASAVRCTTLTADQQFRQGILAGVTALLGFGAFLLDLTLAGTPGQFLLRPAKSGGVDDGGVIILHKVHGPGLAIVTLDFLAQAVHHIGFIEDSISGIFFI